MSRAALAVRCSFRLRSALAAGACVAVLALAGPAGAADRPLRLFVLSGQSNMAGLKPERTFTPAVTAAFPNDEVLVVKSAQGGQPIRRWYKGWKPSDAAADAAPDPKNGDLYAVLLKAVREAVGDRKPDSVCFVWMQGERDAREKHASVYAASLKGLVTQLRGDLGRPDMRIVIGRLSDFSDTANWNGIRAAQVKVAEADPWGGWVDTDDLNGEKNDLHYDRQGYDELGQRFAAKAVELLARPAPAARP
jgi:hypothetical protein